MLKPLMVMESSFARSASHFKVIVIAFRAPSISFVPTIVATVNVEPTYINVGTMSTSAIPLVDPDMVAAMVGVIGPTAVPKLVN